MFIFFEKNEKMRDVEKLIKLKMSYLWCMRKKNINLDNSKINIKLIAIFFL